MRIRVDGSGDVRSKIIFPGENWPRACIDKQTRVHNGLAHRQTNGKESTKRKLDYLRSVRFFLVVTFADSQCALNRDVTHRTG